MPLSIDIDDELRTRIERLADQRQRPTSWIMREAVAQYVAREESRDSFLAEADAAWTAFEADGLHLSGDETRSWLRRWGEVDDAAPPACHGSS